MTEEGFTKDFARLDVNAVIVTGSARAVWLCATRNNSWRKDRVRHDWLSSHSVSSEDT
jgi:hypothetical protein